jgi:hypothetical protein
MSATLVTPKTTSGGEIIRELVNASDGAGLHLQGGAIDLASPPDLGSKFSFEFVLKADEWPTTSDNDLIHFGNGGNFLFYGNDSAGGNLGIYDGTSFKTLGVTILDDFKVHHLVLTVDGAAATLYDNGNQVATATIATGHGIDNCSDAKIGSNYASATTDNFIGNIYRCRFYNKTLTSAEVQTAYERADVDYADQYGSQTIVIPGDFNGDLDGWNSGNTWNSQTNPSNNMVLAASNTNQYCRTAVTLTKGFKYRVTYTASSLTGSPFFAYAQGGSIAAILATSGSTTITAGTNSAEFTLPDDANPTYFYIASGTASDAVTLDNVSVVRIGCVSDYDLAFANPTQSLTVQDRSGAADGTASASGVTQVQPIIQGNLTSLAVGSAGLPAGVPADGTVRIGSAAATANANGDDLVIANTAGHAGITIRTGNTGSSTDGGLYFSDGNATAEQTAGYLLYLHDQDKMLLGTADTTRLAIDSTGAVSIPSAAGTQVALTVKGGNNLVDNIALNITNQAGDSGTNIRNNGQLFASTLATFSGGIAFQSATTGSGTGTGYTLDKYEEGTFTGSLTAATPPTSVPTATGNYTRIGNLVHFQIKFNNADTSGASGAMEVTGLPFSAANDNDSDFSPINVNFYNLPVSNSVGQIDRNESKIKFYNLVNNAAWNNYTISAGTGKYLFISGIYKV